MQQRSYNHKDSLLQLGNYYQNYSSYDSTMVTYQQGLELTDRIDSFIRSAVKEEVSAPTGSMFYHSIADLPNLKS
jgi:hypothetical protein